MAARLGGVPMKNEVSQQRLQTRLVKGHHHIALVEKLEVTQQPDLKNGWHREC
jgi:hypothetical protein